MARKVLSASDFFRTLQGMPDNLRREICVRKTPKGQANAIEVKSYRALARVIGYHWYRSENAVLLRGQVECYGSLRASACRAPAEGWTGLGLDAFCERFRRDTGLDVGGGEKHSTEPLLQHYGIKTRWLDFVDSIPHALYFATHAQVPSPFTAGHQTYLAAPAGRGVIYIVDAGKLSQLSEDGVGVPGLFQTDWGGVVCDLRRAKPALALRPHAQHGWLVRASDAAPDLWGRLILKVVFDVEAALRWLGGGESLAREAMFPPPAWDGMFKFLLGKKASSVLMTPEAAACQVGDIAKYDFHCLERGPRPADGCVREA